MRFFFLLIQLIAFLCLAQGIAGFCAAQEKDQRKETAQRNKLRITEEKGPAGHQTIGIDESSIPGELPMEPSLKFSLLINWQYDPKTNPPPPENIKKMDGRKVKITGFMFPLQEGKAILHFCLLRTTQTCCYGPRPQYNQYIFVEMSKPTTFYRFDPVSCTGTFKVDPSPQEGFIYRLEGERCELASGEKHLGGK